MVRKDRNGIRAGGGVAVICGKDWKIKAINANGQFEFETLWCKITTPKSEFFPSAVAIRNDNTLRTGDPFREAAPVPRPVGKEVGGQENQADGLTANAPHPWG